MRRPLGVRAFAVAALLCGASFPVAGAELWPTPAERTGIEAPAALHLRFGLEASGMYVPRVASLSPGATAMAGGAGLWNLGLVPWLAAFGEHRVTGLWWANVALVTLGHEVGLRASPHPRLAIEAAYLGHRLEHQWVDRSYFAVGGVRDHGAELGAWGRALLLPRIRLDGHLLGRVFFEPNGRGEGGKDTHQYTDNQAVVGAALRLDLLPFDGQALRFELEELLVFRPHHELRHTEPRTFNTIGHVEYRVALTERFGLRLAGRLSSNMLVGEEPMLELKRSMIDEPMASASVGAFFEL